MAHSTEHFAQTDLPPLPDYQLAPLPRLISLLPDKFLTLLLPFAAYWGLSMLFHWIDTMDYFPQYRLHTPAEVSKRNRVSRWDVVRDVLVQQAVQTVMGVLLGISEPDDTCGKESYDIAMWARRIRVAQRVFPRVLSLVGVNPKELAENMTPSYPMLSGAIRGGQYPLLKSVIVDGNGQHRAVPSFAAWEVLAATAIYWYIIPALQFIMGMLIVDTWQYFLHRAMHMNKWLYNTFHSRHHRLYVPYAYGALYNHPVEGFILDTLGATIAFKVTSMNTRQAMWFFTGLTLKTVDDHCGYSLPWDPIQYLSSNNAGYHDVHHQSWGIKTNFSQPCSVFWDWLLGTMWTGGDVSARYERSRIAAQKMVDKENEQVPVTGSDVSQSATQDLGPYENELSNATDLQSIPIKYQQPSAPAGKAEYQAAGSRQQVLDDKKDGGIDVLQDEAREEQLARTALKRSTRRRTQSSVSQADSFKGLRDRITGSMHGRTGGILGVESSR
ncbi:hypothetical protein MMC07_008864 [Pseudocyphellaria aurata]|nr:hypothetical protein [Pseudocyphellaria aurata]